MIWGRVLEQNPQPKQQDRLGTYESNTDARSRKNFCLAKTRNITYSECLSVPIVIQHTKRMRHIIFSSVACLAVLNFSHYLINRTIFRNKLVSLCILIFSTTLSEIFLFLRKTQRDISINVRTSSCKVPVILGRFQ